MLNKAITAVTATVLALLLGCSNLTIGVAVSAVGVAAAGLEAYCGINPGCPAALTSYAQLLVTESQKDAAILESGQATSAEVNAILATLQMDLATGQAITGLTPQQQQEAAAIVGSIGALLPLIEQLVTHTPVGQKQVTFKLTANDHKALVKMRAKIASVKAPKAAR